MNMLLQLVAVVCGALCVACFYGVWKFGKEQKGVQAILCGLVGYVSGLASGVSVLRLAMQWVGVSSG